MFYFILYFLILMVLSLFLNCCKCKNKFMNEIKKKLNVFIILNQLFIFFQEGFIEILVSCIINYHNIINITWSDKISSVFTVIYLVLSLTLVPGLIIYVLTFSEEKLKKKSTYKKFGGAYESLKIKSKFYLFYNLLYIIRRIMLVFVLFSPFFTSHICLQIQACIYINNFCCMYLLWHKPYIERGRNYNEISNEITIVIVTEAMLMYTEICSPEQ